MSTKLKQITFDTQGSHSWTCPAGVYSVNAVACGGGGGGGGGGRYINTVGNSDRAALGGGGGEPGLAYHKVINTVPGTVYEIYVGAGGEGGAGGTTDYSEGVFGLGGENTAIYVPGVAGNLLFALGGRGGVKGVIFTIDQIGIGHGGIGMFNNMIQIATNSTHEQFYKFYERIGIVDDVYVTGGRSGGCSTINNDPVGAGGAGMGGESTFNKVSPIGLAAALIGEDASGFGCGGGGGGAVGGGVNYPWTGISAGSGGRGFHGFCQLSYLIG